MEVKFRLWVTCPSCGRRPLDRISHAEKILHGGVPADQIAKSLKCRCGTIYIVRAAAYQHATLDRTPQTA